MKPKAFAVGDRVKVLRGGRMPFVGKVDAVTEGHIGKSDGIFVIEDGFYSNHEDSPFHPRQCVKLVKKIKAITLTEQRLESVLAAYWNSCLTRNYFTQLEFVKSYFKLGTVKETIVSQAP